MIEPLIRIFLIEMGVKPLFNAGKNKERLGNGLEQSEPKVVAATEYPFFSLGKSITISRQI